MINVCEISVLKMIDLLKGWLFKDKSPMYPNSWLLITTEVYWKKDLMFNYNLFYVK